MSTAGVVARSARRRMTVRLLLAKLGPALLIGSAGSLTLVAADKFTSLHVPWYLTIGTPLVAGAGVAAWLAWRARPSLLGAAGEVDRVLRLKDRVSTAMVLERDDDPFAAIAVEQGQAAAAGARVDRAVPIRLGRSWAAWPVVLAGAILAAWFLPELSPTLRREAAVHQRTMAQARDVSQRLDEAVKVVADSARDAPRASDEQLASLRDLQRELDATAEGKPPALTPDQAIGRAAEALETAASHQDARAEVLRREAEQSQAELDRLRASDAGQGGSESPLARAIREGDLETARRAASQLLRQGRAPNDRSRAQAARDLARLAEELRQLDAAKAASQAAAGERSGPDADTRAPTGSTGADHRSTPASEGPDQAKSPQSGADRASDVDELQRRLADAARQLDPAAAGEGEQEAREQARASAPPPEAAPAPNPHEPQDARNEPQRETPPRPAGGTPPESSPGRESPGTGERNTNSQKRQPAEQPAAPNAGKESPDRANGDKPGAQSEQSGGGREQSVPGQPSGQQPTPQRSPTAPPPGESREKGEVDAKEQSQTGDRPTPERAGESPSSGKPAATPATSPKSQGTQAGQKPSSQPSPQNTAPADERRPWASPRENGEPAAKATPNGEQPAGSGPQASPGSSQQPSPSQGESGPPRGPNGQPQAGPNAGAGPESRPQQPGGSAKSGQPSEKNGATSGSQGSPQAKGDRGPAASEGTPGKETPPDSISPAQRRALERLSEQIDKMSERPGNAAEHEKNAERLREQARRLYDSASPDQRERMERWMQQAAQDQPPRNSNGNQGEGNPRPELAQAKPGAQSGLGPQDGGGSPGSGSTRGGGAPTHGFAPASEDQASRTTPIDARSARDRTDSGNEQVVAEWLGSGDERRAPAEQAAVRTRLSEAARSAERAIGDRAVPARYDRILREYFRRLPEKVAPGGTPAAPAPAAEPATDGGRGR